MQLTIVPAIERVRRVAGVAGRLGEDWAGVEVDDLHLLGRHVLGDLLQEQVAGVLGHAVASHVRSGVPVLDGQCGHMHEILPPQASSASWRTVSQNWRTHECGAYIGAVGAPALLLVKVVCKLHLGAHVHAK